MVQRECKYRCCKAIFCPLKPAWARTIHTTQSLQAGPSKDNKKCHFKKLIGNPGSIDFEKRVPGLFYVLLSRATTIGRLDGKQDDSALYFFGCNMCEDRIINLIKNKDGSTSKAIKKRNLWVRYLNSRLKKWRNNNKQYFKEDTINMIQQTFKKIEIKIEEAIEKYIEKNQEEKFKKKYNEQLQKFYSV